MKLAYKLFNTRGGFRLQSYNRNYSDSNGFGLEYGQGETTVPKIEGSMLFVLTGTSTDIFNTFGLNNRSDSWIQLWLVECDTLISVDLPMVEDWLDHTIPHNEVDNYKTMLLDFPMLKFTKMCNSVKPIVRIKI